MAVYLLCPSTESICLCIFGFVCLQVCSLGREVSACQSWNIHSTRREFDEPLWHLHTLHPHFHFLSSASIYRAPIPPPPVKRSGSHCMLSAVMMKRNPQCTALTFPSWENGMWKKKEQKISYPLEHVGWKAFIQAFIAVLWRLSCQNWCFTWCSLRFISPCHNGNGTQFEIHGKFNVGGAAVHFLVWLLTSLSKLSWIWSTWMCYVFT